MLVINVFYKCKPEKREGFLEMIEKEGIRTGSLAEEGNLAYRYYIPVADESELFLYEEWKDADAQALHCMTPHFQRLQELKDEYLESTAVNKFITE